MLKSMGMNFIRLRPACRSEGFLYNPYYENGEKLLDWSSDQKTQTQVSYSLGAKIQETNPGWEIIFTLVELLCHATEVS